MWAELAGSAAALLSLLPYYLGERGLPSVGIGADGSISRAGAKRVGGGGLAAIALWFVVRRLAAVRRRSGRRGASPDMRVEDWLSSQGLGECTAVLGELGYDQRIDMLIVRDTRATALLDLLS